MRRRILSLIALICLMSLTVFGLTSCGDDPVTEPEKLVAPVVTLVDDLATWEANPNAEKFEISLSGELSYVENSNVSKKLTDGQSLKVRAIGNGINYITSEWSNVVTYTAPQTHTHDFSGAWKTDATHHWHECSCGELDTKVAHSGGTATTTEKAKCEVCGESYGELLALPTHECDFTGEWKHDETYHWNECSCGKTDTKLVHNGGEATTSEKAICEVCGISYGDLRKTSEGLELKLNEDGQSYSVIGIGTCTDKDVIIPSIHNDLPVTVIGEEAFDFCNDLTSIEIPNSVKIIDAGAFETCFDLMSIIFEDGIKLESIGYDVFNHCDNLNYTKYENAKYLGSVNNPYLVLVSAVDKTIEEVIINEHTQIICSGAFSNCDSLKNVVFEEGIKLDSIGNSTFSGCDNLASIKIPSSVTSIERYAFSRCYSLTSVTFEEGSKLERIDENAFTNCNFKWIEIPYGVTSIEKYAFENCYNLTNIVIPNSVTNINLFAFHSCWRLTIYCEEESKPDGWNSSWNYDNRPVYWGVAKEDIIEDNEIQYLIIDGEAIITRYIGSATEIIIPSNIDVNGNQYNVTSIGKAAFSESNSLTRVEISTGILSIKGQAFYDCDSLTSITIPNGVKRVDGSFYSCDSLTIYCEEEFQPNGWDITWNYDGIPVYWGVTKEDIIEVNDFHFLIINGEAIITRYIGNAENVVIPSNIDVNGNQYDVTSIGNAAFSSSDDVIGIEIPESITSIERYAFSRCYSLTSVTFEEGSKLESIGYDVFNHCDNLNYTEYENAKYLGSVNNPYLVLVSAVDKTIEEVIIHEQTQIISNHAFDDCSSLTSIEIPSGVTNICEYAFTSCSSLVSVIIPTGVKSIDSAFFNCFSLTIYCEEESKPNGWDSSWVADDIPVYWGVTKEDIIEVNDIHYLIINGEAIITRYIGNAENVVILSNIDVNGNQYDVTSIGNAAFSSSDDVIGIEIPESIISIGDLAFSSCDSLTSVTFEERIKLESISSSAFEGCPNLNYTEYENAKYLGNDDNPYLALINIIDKNVEEVIINEQTQILCSSAFESCSSLKSVIFEEGSKLEVIDDSVFEWCTSLTSIVIPNSVTNIDTYAFTGCRSLTSIVIPSSVISISNYAFTGCYSLTIYCEVESQLENWNSNWNYNNYPVYWAGEWEYDSNGNPIPLN